MRGKEEEEVGGGMQRCGCFRIQTGIRDKLGSDRPLHVGCEFQMMCCVSALLQVPVTPSYLPSHQSPPGPSVCATCLQLLVDQNVVVLVVTTDLDTHLSGLLYLPHIEIEIAHFRSSY